MTELSNSPPRRSASGGASDGVGSLIGILLTLAILGGVAAIVLGVQGGDPNKISGPDTSGGITVPGSGQVIQAAAMAACRADYQAAQAAVSEFQVERGSLPTSTAQLQRMLRDPLGGRSFTIGIDAHRPGTLQVAAGAHPASDGDANCAYAG